jgi:hypothetical protein
MSWLISTRTLPFDIAGVAPTLDYLFALDRRRVEAVSLTDKLTFTGGNEGTFVGSDGYIQRAQTNVPRFTHDPLTRRSLGMLLEGSGGNLLLRSEEFNDASWGKIGASLTANTTLSPDGSQNADTFTNTAGVTSLIAQSVTVTASSTNDYCFSLFVKADSVNTITLNAYYSGNTEDNVTFSLTTQTATAAQGSPTNLFIRNVGNGWYRIGYCLTRDSTGTQTTILSRVWVPVRGNGVIGNSIFLWGAQLNTGPLTSYIPTTTAAVTRTADSAVIDGAGILTGAYTMVEKPEGCAVISGTNINLQTGFTAERVMVFPAALSLQQITAIRNIM